MKFINIVTVLALTAGTAMSWAKSADPGKPVMERCELALGRSMAVQVKMPAAGKPTFLLLPGINRATLLSDKAIEALTKDGSGVVTFNFTVQPLSIAELGANEKADLENVTLKSLADETMALVKKVESDYGIKNMIPVSLSYSGAISPLLTKFPTVIDMVPLTSMEAFSPQLAMTYNQLKAAELFNPIFGPTITRNTLDAAYRYQWSSQVDGIVEQFGLTSNRRSEMIEGYTTLSRAVEGYSWLENLPSKKVKRVFVLAENESPRLLTDQLRTILAMKEKGYDLAVIVVAESGHIIPSDQPLAYVTALKGVAMNKIPSQSVTIINASKGTAVTVDGEQATEFLHKLLKKSGG